MENKIELQWPEKCECGAELLPHSNNFEHGARKQCRGVGCFLDTSPLEYVTREELATALRVARSELQDHNSEYEHHTDLGPIDSLLARCDSRKGVR